LAKHTCIACSSNTYIVAMKYVCMNLDHNNIVISTLDIINLNVISKVEIAIITCTRDMPYSGRVCIYPDQGFSVASTSAIALIQYGNHGWTRLYINKLVHNIIGPVIIKQTCT
jgi:hypothetical protein